MEFYIARNFTFIECVSFNSQRDGILPYTYNLDDHFDWVSIPNGMEFYLEPEIWGSMVGRGFNSQRDGILQDIWLISQDLSRFNSQRDGILPCLFR